MIPVKYILAVLLLGPTPFLLDLSYWSITLVQFVLYTVEPPHPTYDFIVVGAGSAGSVVAGRLAQAGHSVVLLDAGGPAPSLANIPALAAYMQKGGIDWQYKTEKTEDALWSSDGANNYPRGKVLGGSSILNYMIYLRGHSKDYDEWASLGVDGWSYDEVLPFFKKSENYEDELPKDDKYHGRGGPLSTAKKSHTDPIADTFLQAGVEAGYGVGDMNGAGEDGTFSYLPVSLKKGERQGTFKAFAEDQVGKNLRVITHAHVTKLLLEGDTVKGVEFRRFGGMESVFASKEVVLSAGSIGTPQILQLSGIGDKDELTNVGIEPVLHSPQVGKNLQDHLLAVSSFSINQSDVLIDLFASAYPKTYQDYANGGGPLTNIGGCQGSAFIHSRLKNDSRPDIQLIFMGWTHKTDYGLKIRHLAPINEETWNYIGTQKIGATFFPVLIRPKSRGYIKLRSKDPFEHPIIQPNFLQEEEDVDTLASGLQFCRSLLDTPAFKALNATAWDSVPACSHLQFESFDYYKCIARFWSNTLYHPVGTAAMGTVLDSKLRLKGLKNLRVADGSAIPKIMGANTNAPIIMIGERAADFIIKAWKSTNTKDKTKKMETKKTEL